VVGFREPGGLERGMDIIVALHLRERVLVLAAFREGG
jgi:hypothetical protein